MGRKRCAQQSLCERSHLVSFLEASNVQLHFHVGGSLAVGTVNVHMTKRRDESDFKYHHLALDVPGHERIWLENAEAWKLDKRASGKMFGVRWW